MRFNDELKAKFERLGKVVENDTTDYIEKVLAALPTRFPNKDRVKIKKWLIDSVANLFVEDRNTNTNFLALVGDSGLGKTTFLTDLFAHFTRESYWGWFSIIDKDGLITMSESLFVNTKDCFNDLKEENKVALKNRMNLDRIVVRKHYARTTSTMPRIANFCGEFNESPPLLNFPAFVIEMTGKYESVASKYVLAMWGQVYNLYKNDKSCNLKK